MQEGGDPVNAVERDRPWNRLRGAAQHQSLRLACLPLVVMVAFSEHAPPGKAELDKMIGWVLSFLSWAAGIAFMLVGGLFCWAYINGDGTSKTMRALVSVATGCVLISVSSVIAKAVLK